ncbi:MAG TPA: NADH-quinone oxidoreductase subunit H [Spirochaetia bacterium]|nr:NADH-quinone oxidoreductase subunit H [Spirochaetia bacterium]
MLNELTAFLGTAGIDDYIKMGGFEGLKKAVQMKPLEIINEIKKSNLRGRGGAGFPTGVKWESVPEIFPRYIVCNADEGEPGTFKDRLLLEKSPFLILEGMAIAGAANQSEKGYIYIRGEYPKETKIIEQAIQDAMKKGFLGKNIQGSRFSFEIEVKRGGGSYIVGDETALLNSLMGFRGNPWLKPPYPTQAGLWDKPTIVNNVETLACVTLIMKKGAEYFSSIGTPESPGPKLFCLSGNLKKPGVYEFPMGVTLKEILKEVEVKGNLKAVQIGGTAGPIYNTEALDYKLDFFHMKKIGGSLGSGAIIVMNEHVNMTDVLEVEMRFFSEESCGKCFPCRFGTRQLEYMANKIVLGEGKLEYLPLMEKTVETMEKTSFCPFGQSVIMPLKGIFKNFKPEIESFIKHQKYIRGGRYE